MRTEVHLRRADNRERPEMMCSRCSARIGQRRLPKCSTRCAAVRFMIGPLSRDTRNSRAENTEPQSASNLRRVRTRAVKEPARRSNYPSTNSRTDTRPARGAAVTQTFITIAAAAVWCVAAGSSTRSSDAGRVAVRNGSLDRMRKISRAHRRNTRAKTGNGPQRPRSLSMKTAGCCPGNNSGNRKIPKPTQFLKK